jgi:uncharacterized protein YeaO (DUF488 family)
VIKIKRVYEPAEASDGQRFLVDRVWPRGMRKEDAHVEGWLKELGPSAELRKWFGHDPARWAEFQRRYRLELESKPEAFQPLLDAARQGDLTLVYSARDEQYNQAVVLRDVLWEAVKSTRG